MISRFLVLLTLYTCVMFVGNMRFGQDDTRLTGVHIRTLVSVLQVWIISVLLSLYCLFMFFIHVVKSERTSFVLVSHRASADDMCLFELEDAPPEEDGKSPKPRFDTACAAQPQSTSTFETEPTGNAEPTVDTEPKATFDAESDVLSVMSDPLPLSIVFEKSTNLDLYVLYVNFLGLMLWGTFISFNFSTPDTNFIVMSGIVLGWTFNTLSGQCRCHESKTPVVAGEKLRILFYTFISLLVMALGATIWQMPPDVDLADAVNVYVPALCCGFFWTAAGHEVAFTGVKNLHVTRGILYDTRRSLPTFLLVVSVSALCSSPETRSMVIGYVGGLSRLAAVHLLLVEPVLIFFSVYVMVIALERQRATDFSIAIVLVEGVRMVYQRETHDPIVVTAIVACAILFFVHASHLSRA